MKMIKMNKMNIAVLIVIMMMVLAGGCDRYIESEDLEFTLPEAPPVPTAVMATHLVENIRLSWDISDTLPGLTFNVYYTDSLGKIPTLWENSVEYSSILTGLVPGRQYYFSVASVLSNGLEGLPSEPVSSSPGILSIVINDGDMFTDSRNVLIDFIVPVASNLMQLTEDPLFSGAVWESYSAVKPFELSPGDGVKHVYARFRFTDGSQSDMVEAVSDSIILDSEALIESVYFSPDDVTFSAGDSIEFFLLTTEGGGDARVSFAGQSALRLEYNELQSNPAGGEYVYSRQYEIPAGLELFDGVVTGGYIDAAGNSAPSVNAPTLLNISNPPTPVTMTAVSESSSAIRLNWSQAIDNDFAAYQVYRGLDASVSNSSEPISVISSRTMQAFKDESLDESTEYFYKIYVYDNTGLFAGSDVVSSVTLVNQNPTPVTLAVRVIGDAVLTWTVNGDDDFDSYRIYRAASIPASIDQEAPIEIINSREGTSFTDTPGTGTYYYGVAVFDQQGKWAISNWVEAIVF